MVNDHGAPVVADFGISRLFTADLNSQSSQSVSVNVKEGSYLRWNAASQIKTGNTSFSKTVLGTLRWCAHEQFAVEDNSIVPLNETTDIWAFGMIILVSLLSSPSTFSPLTTLQELLTLKVPYYYMKSEAEVILAIASGERPRVPETFVKWNRLCQALWSVCGDCWVLEAAERPRMSQLATRLHNLRYPRGPFDFSARLHLRPEVRPILLTFV